MDASETRYSPPEPSPSDPGTADFRPLEAGMTVGHKYRLLGRVASGGMGEVWRARNEATEAEVAVKVSLLKEAPLDERFRREAKLASELSHRNVVRTFDLVEDDDGRVLLVMELLRGESLQDYLGEHGSLDPLDAVAVTVAVLAGLAQAHDAGIVHRDIKPANVFLAVDPDGHVTPKVIDFGIAKRPSAGHNTLDGNILGTPSYMAPEQIRAGAVDGRADIFSVAIVLYEAITGEAPFDAHSPSATLAAVLEREVARPTQIQPALWEVIDRALHKSADDRYPSAQAMSEAMVTAVGQTAVSLALRLEAIRPRRRSGVASVERCNPDASTRGPSPIGMPLRTRPALRSSGLAAAAIALGTTVAVGLAFGNWRAPAEPGLMAGAAEQPAGFAGEAIPFAAANPSPPEAAVTVSPAASSALAPYAPGSRPAASSSSRSRHAKPIGTTPGF